MAADACIDNVEVELRIFCEKPVCREVHIAISERSVCSIKPAGVCNAVADENNRLVWLQIYLRFH
jgi:hypothetical protein